jgi:hypothetical protein
MEYKRSVQTVVETPSNLAIANKLFSEKERALVAADPECGTGGFRRSSLQGKEKSCGVPVVYIWRNERFRAPIAH